LVWLFYKIVKVSESVFNISIINAKSEMVVKLCCYEIEPHPTLPLKNKGRAKSLIMWLFLPFPYFLREGAGGWV
jgi:hypothetical protein